MDRIISLLAALVGLIALGGAILVHVNGDVQRKELAAEVAELRSAVLSGVTPSAASAEQVSGSSAPALASSSAPDSSAAAPSLDARAAEIKQLRDRIAELEAQNRSQASALAEAQAKLASASSEARPSVNASSSPAPQLLSSSSSMSTASSSSSSAEGAPSSLAASSASGPTTDCIPTGTRFVGKPGDSFAICKTEISVKIAAVAEGVATIAGVGPIAAGSFGDIPGKGCSVMVFSADATGYADLRVTCQ